MIRYILFLASGLLMAVACQSDRVNEGADLSDYIEQCHTQGQFNGAILVAENDVLLLRTALGQNADGEDLSVQDQFRLASVSKQFTATGIMVLYERGLLDFDDAVEKHIPEWPYRGATIRNLLNHTSGIPDYMTLADRFWKPELESTDPGRTIGGNQDIIDLFVEYRPQPYFAPGDQYEYSNTGYVLLASIAERVSGEPFHEFMRENVFLPAAMENTYVFSPLRPDPLDKRVYGWRRSIDGRLREPNDYHYLNPAAGDGGIYSTLDDLYNWHKALYTEKVVRQATLTQAFTPATLNNGEKTDYGFGWNVYREDDGDLLVLHGGSWVGFRTWIKRDVDDNRLVVILTNNSSPYSDAIAENVDRILGGGQPDLPRLSIADLMGEIILTRGMPAARSEYERLFAEESGNYDFAPWELNALGYRFLSEGLDQLAIQVFQLNLETYPGDPNLWDSLGDGFLARQDTANAVDAFEKALELNPEQLVTARKLNAVTAD